MSFKNNWIDKEGRVFIYFTVEEIMKRRNISKPTAIKTFFTNFKCSIIPPKMSLM
ncbi:TPA: replication initiator protein A [Streptococcus pneumoniae]|nr:hypothetical protein EQH22_04580 [Streptococcus pneumoniae]UKP62289.1 hypothetical protein EQH21_04565 [Streptococcus pneumoniae]HET0209350.1 replication initiator protein A [Streptococcus pneumoniae]HET4392264.1 replication initiator protein A [Streptococcus pneumoniae]HET4418587.1 replication initiator protein A [Streptococcus pneumoniae]